VTEDRAHLGDGGKPSAHALDSPGTSADEGVRELGSGAYRYRVEVGWGVLPEGIVMGEVGGVGVDRADRVYVFNRGPHPMLVFDRTGAFLTSWGEGIFTRPHGVHIASDDTLWLTDDGDHTVRHCSLEGEVLLEIGTPGCPAPYMSGAPFHRCTHTCLGPDGDLYVSDGYGNARIHHFSADGRLLGGFGESGIGPGQFNCPHNIACDADGWLYVADRENHRIQVFDARGVYETEWRGVHRPSALCASPGRAPVCFVGEIGPVFEFNRDAPNLGPRLSVFSAAGELLARLAAEPSSGTAPGQFLSPHGIALDSHGDLYVGEVAETAWPQRFPGRPMPSPLRSLQKLVHLPA